MSGRGLVLGGGGITGIAWELGLLAGLAEAGVDLAAADLVVGTSAGSVVGAELTSGAPLEELYARQLEPPSAEIGARLRGWTLVRFVVASWWGADDTAARARLGRMALRARTVSEEERRKVIEARLPHRDWPQQRLIITAVVAETGEFLALDRDSGVPLLDAVGASCAVPLVWPPVTVGGGPDDSSTRLRRCRCIDGGMRSPANADLATGCDRVVVVAPIARSLRPSGRLSRQIASLGPDVRAVVVTPSPAARAEMGSDVLNPAFRAASARAGRAQAKEAVDRVRAVWG